MSRRLFFPAVAVAALFSSLLAWPQGAKAETVLHHVHGLAFAPDGTLIVPSHMGLALYGNGRWSRAAGPMHDYMGFSMTGGAIYSSGHPAPGSPLANPFGLIKSSDGGKSWRNLGLSGEADFHFMAAGWKSNAVYVINDQPNSRMPQRGLYRTTDDGKTWAYAEAQGIRSQLFSLAAHPTDPLTVAVGTLRDGLMLSRDSGKTFRRLGSEETVTAVTFQYDGKSVLYAAPAAGSLVRRAVSGDSQTRMALPALGKDFVVFMAQNPADHKELAVATRHRNVYLSKDNGRSWRQIAKEGEEP